MWIFERVLMGFATDGRNDYVQANAEKIFQIEGAVINSSHKNEDKLTDLSKIIGEMTEWMN